MYYIIRRVGCSSHFGTMPIFRTIVESLSDVYFRKSLSRGVLFHHVGHVGTSLGNLTTLLEGLKIAVESKSEDKVPRLLDSIVVQAPECGAECNLETHQALAQQLGALLGWDVAGSAAVVVAGAARAVAELAKLDAGREACAACAPLMRSLLRLLSARTDATAEAVALQTQACRALGNICYENDDGRAQVLAAEGLPRLIQLMERAKASDGEEGRQMRNVSAGFLLNLLASQEENQTKALELGVIPLLSAFLELDCADEEVSTHVLMILGLLADAEPSQELLDDRLCKVIVRVLEETTSAEVSEMCLDLLHGQAENENVKVRLAHAGLCELLLKLLQKHRPLVQDDETRNLMKLACDLIVLVLTGDESMNILYGEGEGHVFKDMVSWLESEDEDLQVTGVLAMGNFARTDKHCIHMVQRGVSKKLLRLVARNNTAAGDIRLQHALLSALRNLVIPAQNKASLLSDGLVETILPMATIPTFPVVFKLLGTLRMVIDGKEEAAQELGTKAELLQRLVQWCATEDHPGVQGEANRLLAWLVKNSRSSTVMRSVVEAEGLKCLVTMLLAEHAVMQNEALLALALVAGAVSELPSSAAETLASPTLATALVKFFRGSEKLEVPVLLNALALVSVLAAQDAVPALKDKSLRSCFFQGSPKKQLEDAGVGAAVAALSTLRPDERLDREVKRVSAMIDSG